MTEKKKILILCVDFPPWPSVGAQRPASWCLYADPYEFDITVITRKWKDKMNEEADYFINPPSFPDEGKFGQAKVYYTDFKPNLRDRIILSKKSNLIINIIQKVLTGFFYVAPYYISIFDNTRNIYYKAKEYLKNNPDTFMIVATGEPFITFRYAYLLSKKWGIPWCADYRDGWSSNYSVPYLPLLQRVLLKEFLKPLEIKMIKKASLVTTVTPALKQKLQYETGCTPFVIFNGYFHEEINSINNQHYILEEKFTIAYSGTLYPFQPLEEFIDFMENLCRENVIKTDCLKIIFFGSDKYKLRINDAFKNKNIDYFITKKLSKTEILKKLKQAHVLLLLASDKVDGSAAKVYEYIALRKPIFVFKNDNGTIRYLIDYTRSGFLYTDYDSAKKFFLDLYSSYVKGHTEKFQTHPINVEEFSREFQAHKFFQLLKTNGRG